MVAIFISGAVWLSLFTTTAATSFKEVERLIEDLFSNYSTMVRPATNLDVPTHIHMAFTFKQLETVDIKKQNMKSMGYFSVNWTDERLTWDQKEYGDVEYITIPEERIWLPDYVVNNEIANGKKQLRTPGSLVAIRSDGQVLWEPGFTGTTSCEIDITFFPFDKQTCSILVVSWMSSNRSQVTAPMLGIGLFSYTENGEFEIVGTDTTSTCYPMTYTGESLVGVGFFLTFQRRTTFYWLSLVLPLIAFPYLSPLSFLVPADSGEKTTLAITALLSVFVFLGIVFDTMPKLSNTVSYFVVLASAQVFVSLLTVISNVTIVCISKMSPEEPIPLWLQRVVGPGPNQRIKANAVMGENDTPDDELKTPKRPSVTWMSVSRYADKICFFISLISVTLVNIIFFIIFHSA